MQPGDPAQIVENTFSLDNFVAYAVAKENQPLIDALNSGAGRGDRRTAPGRGCTPIGFRARCRRAGNPGRKAAPRRSCPTSPRSPPATSHTPATSAPAPKSTLSQLRDSFLDWDLYRQAIPDLFKTGLPNTLILTVSASVIGLVLGMAPGRRRHLRHRAGCAGRRGSTPTSSAGFPKW